MGHAHHYKTEEVGHKRENHAHTPATHVGKGARRYLQKHTGQLPNSHQNADLEKGKALIQKCEDEEWLEVALILEEAIEAEAK